LNLVVGSGPSAVAAALALLERGQSVTMLDVGRQLDPELAAIPARLAGLEYEAWPHELRERLAAITGRAAGGYPMKTNFGSDFAYRGAPELMPLDVRGADVILSFARGGLSNLWGANVLSFCAEDLRGWPLGEADLAPAYRAVLRHLPLSAARGDDLESLLPLHTERLEPRLLSRQAERLLGDLAEHRDALHARGVRFGPSRLGIRTAPAAGHAACVRCGLCMHGCPIDVIYNSAHTLAELRPHPKFHYQGGLYVTRFRESADGVELEAVRETDGAGLRFSGTRAFLGCGTYATARLVLESLERFGHEVEMLESQYFLVPMLHRWNFPDAPAERLQTLSQVCLRLHDPKVCPHDVQMLIYTYSHLYRAALDATPARFLPPLKRALMGRLLALQGYLHSDVSPHLSLSLQRAGSGPAVLRIEGHRNPATAGIVRRTESRLWSLRGQIKATPIPFRTMIAPPGKSYHGGGTFPMRSTPGPFESDLLGRPMGLSRTHIVDSSVFPTIPATNLTLTVMANAYRIAAECFELDERAGAFGPGRVSA
jgi:choline dehydrogenase-like flavoprotein